MAAFSNNKYDVYSWIIGIAKSCQSVKHKMVVGKLTNQFLKQYDDSSLYYQLCNETDKYSSKAVKTYLKDKK
jgi:hypothetical protein